MFDSYVAFFVNDSVDPALDSEVYIPSMRVVYGEVETRVLDLLGLSTSSIVVMSVQDSSSLRFTLLIDLSAFADKQGHLRVCQLKDCNEAELSLLYEAYLRGQLCPYFKEKVSNAAVNWKGKRRIVSFSCSDMFMDIVLSDGDVVCYSSDETWESFCEVNRIDPVSRESLEKVVENYFTLCFHVSCPEPTSPSMCWTSDETKRLLNGISISGYYPYQLVELDWKYGCRETVRADASKLQALGPLVSSLIEWQRQYQAAVSVRF